MKANITTLLLLQALLFYATAFNIDSLLSKLPEYGVKNYVITRGKPLMHPEAKDLKLFGNYSKKVIIYIDCIEKDCEGRHIVSKTNHKDRVVTDSPIIGILTQPFDILNQDKHHEQSTNSYISASHVKFLESAGARVIPVEYNANQSKLLEILAQINGIYIPGESIQLLSNK